MKAQNNPHGHSMVLPNVFKHELNTLKGTWQGNQRETPTSFFTPIVSNQEKKLQHWHMEPIVIKLFTAIIYE
jgi:hypothetical protein